MSRPILAITLGDPAGIGPEVVLKALGDPKILQRCRPLVVGDAQVLSRAKLRTSLKIRPVLNPAAARYRPGAVDVLHHPIEGISRMPRQRPSAISGQSSFQFVRHSLELAVTKLVDGVVHAPISKTAWKQAGIRYPGHTEMIGHFCEVPRIAMAIASEPLRTVLVTRHIPFKSVPSHINKEEIRIALEQAVLWMKQRKIKSPKIGICGLNPHGGEGGLLGWEEERIIKPAVRSFQKKYPKISVTGPMPADSAYRDHRSGFYDVLITMYHDQSLIPLKLFNSRKLVNISIGLPFPRTSPGHGTAFDIAGKGIADSEPMKEAILSAAQLCS